MSDFQTRVQAATNLGRQGASRAETEADKPTPDELREALGYWNEMIDIARNKTGELINESRNQEPPIPWPEIAAALGISVDAARQRWLYYRNGSS